MPSDDSVLHGGCRGKSPRSRSSPTPNAFARSRSWCWRRERRAKTACAACAIPSPVQLAVLCHALPACTMTKKRVAGMIVLTLLCGGIAVAARMVGPVYMHPVAAMRLFRAEAPRILPGPVEGVRSRDLRDTWNGPRSGGRRHQGIDIFAKRGTPVRSTTSGIVATVGTNSLGGRIVRVFGPAGEWHYYAHLESFSRVQPGDVIAAGTVVGTVGDSGNARGTPPHLHYGIYRMRGGAMNPYPRLAGARDQRTGSPPDANAQPGVGVR